MKKIFPIIIVFYFFFAADCFASVGSSSDEKDSSLTKESVRFVLDSVIASVKDRDVDGLIKYFSEDFVATLKVSEKIRGLINMDLTGYKKALQDSFTAASHYEFQVSDILISIAPGGNIATVTSVVSETIILGDKTISTKSYEVTILELRDGGPKIVFIFARMSFAN